MLSLQFEFAEINFFDRIGIRLVVDLLAQTTQLRERSYQINLRENQFPPNNENWNVNKRMQI